MLWIGRMQLTVAGRIAGRRDRRVLRLAEHEAGIAGVREVLRRVTGRSTERCERRLMLAVRRHVVVRVMTIEQVHRLVARGHRRATAKIGEHLVAGLRLADAAAAEAVRQVDHLGARGGHAVAAIYTVRTARTAGRSIPRVVVRVLRIDMARGAGLVRLLLLRRWHWRLHRLAGQCGGTRGFLRF